MDIVAIAIVIVAAFAGGGAYFVAARQGASAWLAFTLGLFVYGLIMALAPLTLP